MKKFLQQLALDSKRPKAGQPIAPAQDSKRLGRELQNELARLVAMPTYSSGHVTAGSIIAMRERTGSDASVAAIENLYDELTALGLRTKKFESNGYLSVAATSRHTKRPKVMLLSHIDVIPVRHNDMLKLRLEDGKYYGRGVFDMKFAIACYMQFVRSHKDILNELDFGIMVTSDEETGGFHGAKLLADKGWGGDIIINPDGGDKWAVESHAKGIWMGTITAKGTSAHGSRPWEGDSAIKYLVPAINEIMALVDNNNRLGTTCNVSKVNAGESFNQVAGHGQAILDIRSFEESEVEALEARMQAIAAKYSVDLEITKLGSPVNIDPDCRMVQSFARHIEDITGEPISFVHSYGGTDSRFFTDDSMQNIVIRPNGGGSHSDDEWLQAADLVKFYRLIESAVLDSRIA